MIGKTISHYKILEKLGEGGMGVVYKAADTKLDRFVALKFLPHHVSVDEEEKIRFVNEAKATSALDHSNICTIYEINETEDGQMFIAMGYYEGETLKHKIMDGPLVEDEAVDIALQVAKGLARAHEAGVIHRDIKPANIIVTDRGEVKILDFGLAKLSSQAVRVTRVGTTLGTAAYMSPEQAKGEDVDHRTDIWSVGVILYEMLTGEPPFKGEYEAAVAYSILNEDPEPVTEVRDGVYAGLERLVNKALAKNPDERFQKIEDLERELKSRGVGVEPVGEVKSVAGEGINWQRILKRIAIPVGIGVIAALGFLFLKPLLIGGGSPRPIAVMSFENKINDASYDYLKEVIPNLLITNLEQSEYFRVTTMERLYDLQKQAGKVDKEVIDRELGFELCRMDGIDTIVFGSFQKGEEYFFTTVNVYDVNSEKQIKMTTSQGSGVTSIIETQIDELSLNISLGLGVSERKIREEPLRIAEVTTNSMDAYKKFLQGREEYEKFYWNDALRWIEEAIRIDSTFAVAHLYLAWTYDQLSDTQARNEAFERAKRFSGKATDKERLYIEAAYAEKIERNTEWAFKIRQQIVKKYPKEKRVHWDLAMYYNYFSGKELYYEAIEEYKEALKLDPNFGYAINELAYTYVDLRQYDTAIEYFKRYASVSPGDANPFDSMGETYFLMGRFDDAIKKYEEALAIKPDFFFASWSIAYIYALMENYPETMIWIDRFIAMAPSSNIRVQGYAWKGLYHYWLGQWNQALSELNRAVSLANAAGDERWKLLADWIKGWMYYEKGKLGISKQYCVPWFDFAVDYYSEYVPRNTADRKIYLGLANIKEGRLDVARQCLDEVKSLLTAADAEAKDRMAFCYDLLEAEILFAENSVVKAIEIHEKASPLGEPVVLKPFDMLFYNIPLSKDVWARAYGQNGDLDSAIGEYEKLVSFGPDQKERCLVHPLYHYRLGILYEEKGLSREAQAEYGKFLKMWENADRDLPELEDVNRRMKILSGKSDID